MQLPPDTAALLFDVDGVVTDTAKIHARAWKRTFDEVLDELGLTPPFDAEADYHRYVDGMPRFDGVRSFLQSRSIDLPEGDEDDPADALTVRGIGRRKNELLQRILAEEGIDAYPGTIALIKAARERGMPCAVVSSSANARASLRAAGVEDDFQAWVEGNRIAAEQIPGKPKPDMFLTAARDLGVPPEHAVVFEDAISGVAAGRAGGFGCVVGVDRVGQADALRANGADIVVQDLDELELAP